MTSPQPEIPVDQANPLLGETPSRLVTALLETPHGQRLALTIRTPSTTLTVLLNSGDAKTWAQLVTSAAGQMSQSGLIVANGHMQAGG